MLIRENEKIKDDRIYGNVATWQEHSSIVKPITKKTVISIKKDISCFVVEGNNYKDIEERQDNDRLSNKKFGFFNNKIDSTKYAIYFINRKKFNGQNSTTINCANLSIKELQYETFYIKTIYSYQVFDPKIFIEKTISQINGLNNFYSEKQAVEIINSKIEKYIQNNISNCLIENGYQKIDNNKTKIIDSINKDIDTDMFNIGFEVTIENFYIREENPIKEIKRYEEISAYQRNMKNGDDK